MICSEELNFAGKHGFPFQNDKYWSIIIYLRIKEARKLIVLHRMHKLRGKKMSPARFEPQNTQTEKPKLIR